MKHQVKKQDGMILPVLIIITAFLTTVVFSLLTISSTNLKVSRINFYKIAARYAAESGADEAIAMLNAAGVNSQNATYGGTSGDKLLLINNTSGSNYKIVYNTTVEEGVTSSQRIIKSTGKLFSPASRTQPNIKSTIEVTANLKGQRSAASMMSTGIIQVSSNVEITGKDVLVNEYVELTHPNAKIRMNGLQIAGYKAGGGQPCSVGPNGQILLPATGGTQMTLARKNCAKTTQSGVSVTENSSTVSKIGSLEIPWQAYMDSSYTDQGNCTSLVNGGTVNKGHYPNAGSGASGEVATNCGTNGTLALGSKSYTITDHVHIRANLCSQTNVCSPTFTNTSGSLKFIFVEGSINFYDVKVNTGSPIVFVSYSNGVCCNTKTNPKQLGAVYFNGTAANSTANAPNAYFLAPKGDIYVAAKVQSLGGIGGKNIYISTTGGSSHGMPINPSFPFGDIPVDIAWYAARYRQIN